MPTYEYQCQTCLKTGEAVRRIAERHDGPICDCGDRMEQRIFTGRAFVAPDATFDGYRCVATGETITSETQRKQVMKKHDLMDARELPDPDWGQMEEDRSNFHNEASKPVPVPDDLKDALKREGKQEYLDVL